MDVGASLGLLSELTLGSPVGPVLGLVLEVTLGVTDGSSELTLGPAEGTKEEMLKAVPGVTAGAAEGSGVVVVDTDGVKDVIEAAAAVP